MESTQDTELVVRPSRPEDRPGLLRLRREVYGDDVESGREAFFDWLDDTAARNAVQNLDLNDDEVLTIIEQARTDASVEASAG